MLCYIGSLKLIYFIVLKLSWSAETPPKAICHGFLLSLLFAFIFFLRTIVLRGHVTLKYTLFTVVTGGGAGGHIRYIRFQSAQYKFGMTMEK